MSLFNDVADVSQTGDLWCRKRLLNQLSHHEFLILHVIFSFQVQMWKTCDEVKTGFARRNF